jgi:ATP-binding cassette, subfamily B, bacterial
MAVVSGKEISEFQPPKDYGTSRSGPLAYVLSHLIKYWYLFIPSMIIQLFVAIIQSSIPGYIGQISELLLNRELSVPELNRLSMFVLILGVLAGILLLIRGVLIEFVAQSLERNTRDEFYSAILGKSLTFHDKQTIGDLMSRAATDVRQINFMINPGFNLVFQAIVGVIVPFIFIYLINPQLLIVPILFLLSFLYTLRKYNQKLTPVAWGQRMAVSKINSRLNETISGMQLVRSNTQEEYEREIFQNNINEFREISIKQGKIQARYWPLLLLGIATALGLLHALYLVNIGIISLGGAIAFLLLLQLLRFPTFINIFAITVLTMGIASANRLIELIEGETLIDTNVDGKAQEIEGFIEFKDVTFGYQADKPILKNIGFKVNPGETVALVGMTGSGKSTITKLIARLYDPQSGEIFVDNTNVKDWNLASLRYQMSLVEQDVFLFSRSIRENIRLSKPDASDEQIISAAKIAQIHKFISELPEQYDTVIGERGISLSGGQRQRVAIARAILRNPRILILDDASSAIDSQTEDEIQKAISNVLKGRISFLITHRIAQIRKANHIILLDKGEIIGQGTHDELVKSVPKYEQIFSTLDRGITKEVN